MSIFFVKYNDIINIIIADIKILTILNSRLSNNVDNNDKICNKHRFVFLSDVNEKIMLIKKNSKLYKL